MVSTRDETRSTRGDALTGWRHIDRGDTERADGLAERSDLEHVLLALELEGFSADHEGEGGQIAHLRPHARRSAAASRPDGRASRALLHSIGYWPPAPSALVAPSASRSFLTSDVGPAMSDVPESAIADVCLTIVLSPSEIASRSNCQYARRVTGTVCSGPS